MRKITDRTWVSEADSGKYMIIKPAETKKVYKAVMTATGEVLETFSRKTGPGSAEQYLDGCQAATTARRKRFVMHPGDIEWVTR